MDWNKIPSNLHRLLFVLKSNCLICDGGYNCSGAECHCIQLGRLNSSDIELDAVRS